MDPKDTQNHDPVAQLRDRLEANLAEQSKILDSASAAGREMNDEERAKVAELQAAHKRIEDEITLRLNAAEAQARASAPAPRVVIPMDMAAASGTGVPRPGQSSATHPITGRDVPSTSPTHGFASASEWFKAIRTAAVNPAITDRRLTNAQAAATTYANESAGPEGGWAQPPDYSKEIVEAVAGQASLLGRMRPIQSTSNVFQIPVDETTAWGTSGVQAARTAEGAAATVSNLALQARLVTLHKAVTFVNVTEELASDNPASVAYVNRVMGRQLQGLVERWILRGNGVNEPLGILNAPALVSVAAETSGNGAGTLIRKNLAKCSGRLIPGYDAEAFWVGSPSAKIEVLDLMLAANGNTGTALQQGFAGQQLLGHPWITSMEAQAVGTAGDCTIVAPSGFLTLVKGGIQSQATIYFYFDQGLQTLRSYIRIGQVPLLSAVVTPKLDTSTTLSHCVTTATRS